MSAVVFTRIRMTKKKKLAILKKARSYVARPGGWVQGTQVDKHTSRKYFAYCLSGACQQAAIEEGIKDELWSDNVVESISLGKTARKIDRRGEGGEWGDSPKYKNVPDFNDDPKTRKKDVLALIDEKIAELEG